MIRLNIPLLINHGYKLNAPVYFGEYQERIPTDNPITKNGFQLGRKLFYETALSADKSISCGSCHQQELAFTDGKAVSAGIEGKLGETSAMSLANLLWTENFGWAGNFNLLNDQSLGPDQKSNRNASSIGTSGGEIRRFGICV